MISSSIHVKEGCQQAKPQSCMTRSRPYFTQGHYRFQHKRPTRCVVLVYNYNVNMEANNLSMEIYGKRAITVVILLLLGIYHLYQDIWEAKYGELLSNTRETYNLFAEWMQR